MSLNVDIQRIQAMDAALAHAKGMDFTCPCNKHYDCLASYAEGETHDDFLQHYFTSEKEAIIFASLILRVNRTWLEDTKLSKYTPSFMMIQNHKIYTVCARTRYFADRRAEREMKDCLVNKQIQDLYNSLFTTPTNKERDHVKTSTVKTSTVKLLPKPVASVASAKAALLAKVNQRRKSGVRKPVIKKPTRLDVLRRLHCSQPIRYAQGDVVIISPSSTLSNTSLPNTSLPKKTSPLRRNMLTSDLYQLVEAQSLRV